MLALVEITPWHWAGFVLFVLIFLALDLGLFHRHAHEVKFNEAVKWTVVWFSLAMLFALALKFRRGETSALEFVTGYVIELSLSMDNVFVMALIFAAFQIPARYQHRVLYWGILGALVMRGMMIAAGTALVERFVWMFYIFGAFLVFTGLRLIFAGDKEVHPEKNIALRVARRFFPVSTELDGQNFTTLVRGKRALTPLALVLLMVETTDLIFATDSIPAVFSVTTKPFIVFTSNVFAILGLRSLYFVLAGAIDYFRYLKAGLSIVLTFVGVKMLLNPHDQAPRWFQIEIPTAVSLLIVAGIILISVLLSVVVARCEKRREADKANRQD